MPGEMKPMTSEHQKVHVVFAPARIVLFLVTIWMMAADYARGLARSGRSRTFEAPGVENDRRP